MAVKLDKNGNIHRKPLIYKSEFCEMLTEHLSKGKTIASFARMLYADHNIKVSRETIFRWFGKHEEFSAAKEDGLFLAEGWWDDKLQEGIGGGVLNAALVSLIMVNRYNYRTKAKDENDSVTINNNPAPKELTDEEIEAQIQAHKKRRGEK